MLQLIERCPEYTLGYKEYCQELYDNHVIYFRPSNPDTIDEECQNGEKDTERKYFAVVWRLQKDTGWKECYLRSTIKTLSLSVFAKSWEGNWRMS